MLRRLFRPEYGKHVKVTPKRWWSRRERRIARTAAAVLDHQIERPGGWERMAPPSFISLRWERREP